MQTTGISGYSFLNFLKNLGTFCFPSQSNSLTPCSISGEPSFRAKIGNPPISVCPSAKMSPSGRETSFKLRTAFCKALTRSRIVSSTSLTKRNPMAMAKSSSLITSIHSRIYCGRSSSDIAVPQEAHIDTPSASSFRRGASCRHVKIRSRKACNCSWLASESNGCLSRRPGGNGNAE